MKDFTDANLTPGDLVLTDSGKVFRVRQSGSIYDYGQRLVCSEQRSSRKSGWLWPVDAGKGDLFVPVIMLVRVTPFLLESASGDLVGLWHQLTAETRKALRERLRADKRARDERVMRQWLDRPRLYRRMR